MLFVVTIGDACARLSRQRLAQVGVDLKRPADQGVIVRIDDGSAPIPDLDPTDLLADGGALELVIDLGNLYGAHPAPKLLGVEKGLDTDLGDEGCAAA